MLQVHQEILGLISTRNLKVGVIGMGHVGLPLALTFVERAKVRVIGFDVDASKIDALQRSETYIMHIGCPLPRAT